MLAWTLFRWYGGSGPVALDLFKRPSMMVYSLVRSTGSATKNNSVKSRNKINAELRRRLEWRTRVMDDRSLLRG
jgi:hypothetical protein